MSTLNETLSTFTAELQTLTSLDQVREKRRELQAWVREQFQELSSLEQAEKRRVGQELNRIKTEMERLVAERLQELEGAAKSQEGDAGHHLPAGAGYHAAQPYLGGGDTCHGATKAANQDGCSR